MKDHPAQEWPNRLFWHDRSHQSAEIQMIDLLHDIRFLLLATFILLVVK